MKFLIAGAGAIGAYLGARMARAGLDVTLFARGPHLRAMQERGVRVESSEGNLNAHPKVSGNLKEVGPVDVVMLTVKRTAFRPWGAAPAARDGRTDYSSQHPERCAVVVLSRLGEAHAKVRVWSESIPAE